MMGKVKKMLERKGVSYKKKEDQLNEKPINEKK